MEQSKPIEPIVSSGNTLTDNMQINNGISDVIFEEIPKERRAETVTKEFNLSDVKEEHSKIKVDIFGGENPNSFITQPTEPARPEVPAGNYINSPTNTTPGIGSGAPSKEDIRGNVTTIIAVIDYILSYLGMLLAGEGTQNQYTADTSSRKLLETALVDFMYEKKTKMSPLVALILASVTAYGFMFMGAYKRRKDRNEKEEERQYLSNINKKPKEEAANNKVANTPVQKVEDIPFMQTSQIASEPPVPPGTPAPPKKPAFRSSWHTPDPNIIANDKEEVARYVAQGIFPKYKRNDGDPDKYKPIKYTKEGRPIYPGKPPRVGIAPEKEIQKKK